MQRQMLTLVLVLLGMLPAAPRAKAATPAARGVISRVPPQYPEMARRMHVEGTVVLRASVDPNGQVSQTSVESGHPMLAAAAEQALKRWKFAPAPELTKELITLDFRLP